MADVKVILFTKLMNLLIIETKVGILSAAVELIVVLQSNSG